MSNRPEEEWELPETEAEREDRLGIKPRKKLPPTWEVESFVYPSGATYQCQDDAYYKALKEGWEPFAVTPEPRPTVWMRRRT